MVLNTGVKFSTKGKHEGPRSWFPSKNSANPETQNRPPGAMFPFASSLTNFIRTVLWQIWFYSWLQTGRTGEQNKWTKHRSISASPTHQTSQPPNAGRLYIYISEKVLSWKPKHFAKTIILEPMYNDRPIFLSICQHWPILITLLVHNNCPSKLNASCEGKHHVQTNGNFTPWKKRSGHCQSRCRHHGQSQASHRNSAIL